ncbi:predicted protein [Nematostella vectensis]|uniref:Uncharacterized protein n=1 Tax=Nematostella vectensis TaxID=45351 RepID=A7RVQ6_NEMVE|nr:predicted protein [Nematostella vectensis]|eukprot:XP_001636491.1 predicted protein [Nematostella vectensis]
MKKITVLAVFLALGYLHQAAAASWLDKSLDELKKLRGSVENRKADLLFLLDTSGSLSLSNFNTEKKFIRNLLNVIAVGFDATRVEIITFGSDVNRRVPFISEAHEKDTKCTFNEKFANVVHEWGMTNMRGAFEKAYEVCKGTWSGKKRLNIKTTVILITDGHWNWPWQNPDPVPKAQQLIREGVEILAFGVGYGISLSNLQTITANQRAGHTYAFQISNFDEFNKLATYLRGDPYQKSKEWAPVPVSKCRGGCDVTAKCTCGLVYGDYKCSCPMGRKGSGTPGDCTPCGHDTYKSYEGFAEECTKCPKNSGHQKTGQTHISECKCKRGYTGTPENGNDCTIRHCADIKAPDNGDIEGGSCNTAYGSTCKLKCKQGFKETGAKTINCVYKPDTGEVVWDKPATMCQGSVSLEINCKQVLT